MIVIEYDDAQVRQALARLASRSASLAPAMSAIGNAVRYDIMERFDSSTAPDGSRWKPLTAAAIVSRARRSAGSGVKKRRAETLRAFTVGAKPLLDIGLLRNSVRVASVSDSAVVVSAGGGRREKIAAIHNFGGQAGRGRKVRIPARPFMGVSAEGKAEIMDIIRRHLEAA
ncbi:MAG: phage virion morphogenesis protein [Hylemonella sp.]